jgi:hypothetical protein
METSTTTDSTASSPALNPPDTPEVGSASFDFGIRENLHWLKSAVHALHLGGAASGVGVGVPGPAGPAGEPGPAGPEGQAGPAGSFFASWRGAWNEHTDYAVGDIVSDPGGAAVWLAVETPAAGTAPLEPVWAIVLRAPAQA